MRSKIVMTSNVARLTEAADALMNRAVGMPGMGLIEGETGFGKSTATAWLTTRYNGCYVRALATSTPTSLLESICRELQIAKRVSNVMAVEDIVRRLAEQNRPLFIDESDYLADKKRLIETLRDIHDLATVPVILIGMAGIKRRLTHLTQLTGRIAQWVEFGPATLEDVTRIAAELCEVQVSKDLVAKLHRDTGGAIRHVVVGLGQIEGFAMSRALTTIDESQWPRGKQFFIGVAAGKRHHVAVPA